jgi:hypothetical protein
MEKKAFVAYFHIFQEMPVNGEESRWKNGRTIDRRVQIQYKTSKTQSRNFDHCTTNGWSSN